MNTMQSTAHNGGDLKTPVRNRYFYGKMLDVFHLDLEQCYLNEKRWLLNQRIVGYGVVCGLDVALSQDNKSVIVQPGLALDRCGREIIVAAPSSPVSLDPWIKPPAPAPAPAPTPAPTPAPAPSATATDDGKWVHLCLCYHECESDPEPAFSGDCDSDAQCASGSIRERYKLEICDGKVKMPQPKCNLSGVFSNRTLDYAALARYITKACARSPESCCIPLANILVPPAPVPSGSSGTQPGGAPAPYTPPTIDITIRPVVLTNTLLFQMMLCLCGSGEPSPCGGSDY
jgi:hypothetical protein